MEDAIRLLTDFKDFTQQTGSTSFILFGEWLRQKYADQTNYHADDPNVNEAGLDVIASYLIGGLTAYVEVWVKLTYEELPIHSLGDFGILKTVEYMGRPCKKDIANQAIMEHSTCIESIKRLIKAGLLQEETDQQDKRVKRVMLTNEGKLLSASLDKKMMGLGSLLIGNLSELEKKSMIPILKKLNEFHHTLYKERVEVDVKKLYGL